VGVGRTFGLIQDVVNACRLQNGTHSTTGFYSGTVSSGLDLNLRNTELSELLVRDSTLENRHLDEVLLGSLGSFLHSSGNLTCFTQTVTYNSVFISNNYDSCESEGTSTLGNFRYAVDSDQTLLELEVLC